MDNWMNGLMDGCDPAPGFPHQSINPPIHQSIRCVPRRLIVNADDFGRSHSINQAVLRAHREGILTSASLMVNEPDCAEAVALAKANPKLGVGLHLTLLYGRCALPPEKIPGLVNVRGEVFVQDVQHIPAELPELVGPAGFEAEMTARCLAAQARLTQGGLRLARLTLDERGAWELMLDNGITLRLGRQSVDERFDRFLLAAARIVAARATDIAYVDMRYASGFAIGWRAGSKGVQRG